MPKIDHGRPASKTKFVFAPQNIGPIALALVPRNKGKLLANLKKVQKIMASIPD